MSADVVTPDGELLDGKALVLPEPNELDLYDDPGKQIVLACQRANAWLSAGLHVPIEQIVETKAQAAAIAAFAVQKQLGKDAELSAREVQRRAERGTGLAVRRGQEAGELNSRGRNLTDGKISTQSYVGYGTPAVQTYAMTDGVSNEQFEDALDEAKAEGNLSRANVVRKVKGEPLDSRSERHELLYKTRRIKADRVVAGIVQGALIPDTLLDLIDFAALDRGQIPGWIDSLNESISALTRLRNRLRKESTQP